MFGVGCSPHHAREWAPPCDQGRGRCRLRRQAQAAEWAIASDSSRSTPASLGLPRSVILQSVQMSAAVALIAIPTFGWRADNLGRKTMFIASCLFSIAFAFPMFWLLDTKDSTIITLTVVAAISFGQMVGFSVGAPWYSELFPTRLRYSGASLGFQIGAALSGGLTPIIAASLMAWSGATWPISVYLIACACVTLTAAITAPETARAELT